MLDRLQRVQNYFKMSLKEGFKRKITIMKMQELFFFQGFLFTLSKFQLRKFQKMFKFCCL